MKLCLILASLLTLSSNAYSEQEIEIWANDVIPPYSYTNDKNELTGIYIEIVKTAISRMPDYSVKFKTVPWKRAKMAAKHGRAFAILPPYFHAHDWLTDTEPKRPYIWPYSLPLFTQQDVVICNANKLKQPRGNFPQDYAGLEFVMTMGDGRAGELFTQMSKDKKFHVHQVNTILESARLLLYGRADCTVTSKLSFALAMAQLKKSDEIKKNPRLKVLSKLKEAVTISSNKGHLGYTDIDAEKNYPFKKDFVIKFDIEIYKMTRSGEIDEIASRFTDNITHQ